MWWVGYVMYIAVMTSAYSILFGKPEGNEQLGRPWHRWEHNTDIDRIEIGCGLVLFLQDRAHWFDGIGIHR
jgi:hypothetical protein